MATNWSSAYHAPVLAGEVLALVGDARTALDGTLGGGGHSEAMLAHGVSSVVGIDRDPAALEAARERLASYESEGRFRAVRGNYAEAEVMDQAEKQIPRFAQDDTTGFDAILLDLGVSSRQ